METNYLEDRGPSLHSFRVYIESKYNRVTDKNYIKVQKDLLKASGINPNLSNKKTDEIRIKCKLIGESGWVISPFWEPNKNETWYDTWFWIAFHGSSDSILDFFKQDNYYLLKNINGYSRFEVDRSDWFQEAEMLFEQGFYTSCAMLLSAIIDQSIRKSPIDSWKRRIKITDYFDKAVKSTVEDYYINKSIEPLSRYIETSLLLPSLDGFIQRYFNGKYTFEKKVEPNYLERNWLMHGETRRVVSEADCIKLFNAICTLHYVLHTVTGTFYGH
ncbi:hypothetical protein PCCS19_15740 [Paenibacillus sp. CCS19]|uniref:hypothetical protein n=1 Tax=Paenibacillus sp. CCS19 TaxID=3158387 RepID=UPI00256290DF|nr:hypothetical protein [Paenibacillus cellulosilyticus]GMK38520.1 hypothetical protein PCCS19_15740 [Paenibacillus cellulosilyticus]